MYVCPKIYILHTLNKVINAPWSQKNKIVVNIRLKRSVDRSTERKEVKRLFQILDPETSIAECTVGTRDDERRSIRRSKCALAGVSDELAVVSKVNWQLTEQRPTAITSYQIILA